MRGNVKLSLTVVINSRENPGQSLWHLNWGIIFIYNFSGWIHLPHQVLVNINYISVVSWKGLFFLRGRHISWPVLFYFLTMMRAADFLPMEMCLALREKPMSGTLIWRIKNALFASLEGSQEWDYQSWEQLLFVRVCKQSLLKVKPSYASRVPCLLCFFFLTLLIWCTFV